MIIASNLEKSFGPQVLFNSVSFLINPGERIGLVGKNGTGKSTLFNAMTGLIPIANGSIKIYGEDPEEAKEKIGYIPQKNLINWNFPLTVRQVVEMGLTKRNTLNPFSKKNTSLIEESINQVGLKDEIDKNI